MMKHSYFSKLFRLSLAIATSCLVCVLYAQTVAQHVRYKVGILGAPFSHSNTENSQLQVEWNDTNMAKMKALGFNMIQINIAWAYRPYDEALNLEDVVAMPEQFNRTALDERYRNTLRTPEKIVQRSKKLIDRIALCKRYGMRTLFHFGAPNVDQDKPEPYEQCIMDEQTIQRYRTLIRDFGKKFPGVDDLLIYTYDQHAWLCSEYGPCPRCHGVPLHQRLSAFLNKLSSAWKSVNPAGILWWEPWEISAGETYKIMDLLQPGIGLSVHSAIAEVQVALPADRWFKNVVMKAEEKSIPVIGEVFMGGPTEEMEPYTHIACPVATLKALQAVNNGGKLAGIKEYFGNVPDKEDPNLRMTGIFFANPGIAEDAALQQLVRPYGHVAEKVTQYWKIASEAVLYYPWDLTWRIRRIGGSDPSHLMTAAVIKGASWATPSWQSNRKASFMRTDETDPPNFWMREDAQLRFEIAAAKMQEAIALGNELTEKIPISLRKDFDQSVTELKGFCVRTLAYAYHLRETNLADLIRGSLKRNEPVKKDNVEELRAVLLKDQKNQGKEEPVAAALQLLEHDLNAFLNTYFLPSEATGARDINGSSITSN